MLWLYVFDGGEESVMAANLISGAKPAGMRKVLKREIMTFSRHHSLLAVTRCRMQMHGHKLQKLKYLFRSETKFEAVSFFTRSIRVTPNIPSRSPAININIHREIEFGCLPHKPKNSTQTIDQKDAIPCHCSVS
jgi:hypothetical protein